MKRRLFPRSLMPSMQRYRHKLGLMHIYLFVVIWVLVDLGVPFILMFCERILQLCFYYILFVVPISQEDKFLELVWFRWWFASYMCEGMEKKNERQRGLKWICYTISLAGKLPWIKNKWGLASGYWCVYYAEIGYNLPHSCYVWIHWSWITTKLTSLSIYQILELILNLLHFCFKEIDIVFHCVDTLF